MTDTFNPVVIATTTFYNGTELRFRLACEMTQKATKAGHTVVIVDGSKNSDVSHILKETGALVFPQLHKGMGPSRREVFFHSVEVAKEKGTKVVLWMEPEKVDLIRWINKITEPMFSNNADIVIPKRSEEAWKTWPAYQRESEEIANNVYNKVFKMEGYDPLFGPVAFRLRCSPFFVLSHNSQVNDTYIQLWAPQIAKSYGNHRLEKVEVDMVYPPEQRSEEEGILSTEMVQKRQWQLETISKAFITIGTI